MLCNADEPGRLSPRSEGERRAALLSLLEALAEEVAEEVLKTVDKKSRQHNRHHTCPLLKQSIDRTETTR
jgi:hypothetical protein